MNDQQIRELAEKHFPPEPWPMRGENYEPTDLNRSGRTLAESAIREAISLTIEECAQLVSGYHGEVGTVGYKFATTQDLAADIRALAVKP